MSVLVLVLGGLATAAGLALTALGFSIHTRTFDTEYLTPGTIAAIGGLFLVGIGFAVQELERISRALATQPIPRPALPLEATAVTAAQPPVNPVRIPPPPPLPPQPKADLLPAVAGANPPPIPAEHAVAESLPVRFPNLVRLEDSQTVASADVSVMPQASRVPQAARAAEEFSEMREATAVARSANGSAPPRAVPRVDVDGKARFTASPGGAKSPAFNAFWPPVQRRDGQAVSAQIFAPLPPPIPAAPPPFAAVAPPPFAVEPPALPPQIAQSPVADPAAGANPITILKSGVVEGMAYTLYSDGSIEAQLPQGTLRFGSIAALRSHIESTP